MDDAELWSLYVHGKQTYRELGEMFGCSAKTIQRHLWRVQADRPIVTPRMVIVVIDTTYWGRSWGVILFQDAITNQNLLEYRVRNETVSKYMEGIDCLILHGFIIAGIVCEWEERAVRSIPRHTCPDVPVSPAEDHHAVPDGEVHVRCGKRVSPTVFVSDRCAQGSV